ncbi:MAG: hypothetical protein P4K93_09360 [Terracidiphilus sp.]|nr:hypothetical protein [Terracidiphilus sp.]
MTEREQGKIELLAADGAGPHKIGKAIGRHHITVEKHLAKPDAQTRVQDEKAVLADLYRGKARHIVESISEEDIKKASLQQKSISSGVLLDKSLLLTGDVPTIRVEILLQAVADIRAQRERDDLAAEREPRRLPAPA